MLTLTATTSLADCIGKFTAAQCTATGGSVSGNFCITKSGNQFFQTPICSQTEIKEAQARVHHPVHESFVDAFADALANDPFIDFTTIRDKGASATSTSGTFTNQAVGSRTTDVGGGANASYNASKTFNLAANQRLMVGANFRYDSSNTTYDASPLAPGLASAGSNHQSVYTLSAAAGYMINSAYVAAIIDGRWGHGSETDNVAGATGDYGMRGYSTDLFIGNTFTLFDSRTAPSPRMPTKAPPKQTDGYAVLLDLRGHLRYDKDQNNGFTDSTGFMWGAEQEHNWTTGGQAKLSIVAPRQGWIWTPFVAANVDQQFGFSHTFDIPVQTAQVAHTIHFGGPQTFLGASAGIDVRQPSGWDFGVKGFYQKSAEFRIAGGQAYVRYYIPQPR